MRVMVTGHRPPRIGGYQTPNPTEQWVRSAINEILQGLLRKGVDVEGITGMALGTDQIFAEECIRLGIPFIAALPTVGQEKRWPSESQARYHRLLKQASQIVIVDETPGYSVDDPKIKFILRNKWMLDHADMVISVWTGVTRGGTAHASLDAERRGLRMIVANPNLRTLRVCGMADPY